MSEDFRLHILGCGSAKPTLRHWPSAQMLTFRGRSYLIDCGEGCQWQIQRMGLGFSKIRAIFISHLHGDHCFGLPALLSTLSLLKRTEPLDVYGPAQLEEFLVPQLEFFRDSIAYEVRLHYVGTDRVERIFDDGLEVSTFPLEHRVPTCGYLFREPRPLPHLKRDMVIQYNIPEYARRKIKEGADWETPEGQVIPNAELTSPAEPPRAYAYCSDTRYLPQLAEQVKGVDTIYHEATYIEEHAESAHQRFHSTAREAALIAKAAGAKQLVIGHYSSRYKDGEAQLLAEAQAVFPNTILANEGLSVEI